MMYRWGLATAVTTTNPMCWPKLPPFLTVASLFFGSWVSFVIDLGQMLIIQVGIDLSG
jgi:hypothetical protein